MEEEVGQEKVLKQETKPIQDQEVVDQHQHQHQQQEANIDAQDDYSQVREYIRQIWNQLMVGSKGYLNVHELKSVCLGIGMTDMSDEMVNELFASLDQDRDGRVSFEELVEGMFRQQKQQEMESNKEKDSSSETSPSSLNDFLTRTREDRRMKREKTRIENISNLTSLEFDDQEDVLCVIVNPTSPFNLPTPSVDIDIRMKRMEFFSTSPMKLTSTVKNEPVKPSCTPSTSSSKIHHQHHHHHHHHDQGMETILSNSFHLYSLDMEGKEG